ncbi:MAG: hypothetical protein NC078_08015 [Ruminococcus sp.]|nr:hypothetical protein [Ruminococcus sp.]
MKELLKALQATEEKANEIDRAWDADPENEALEAAFDEAYAAEYKAHEALANEIVRTTSGRIDFKTASAMINKKRAELENLIARLS